MGFFGVVRSVGLVGGLISHLLFSSFSPLFACCSGDGKLGDSRERNDIPSPPFALCLALGWYGGTFVCFVSEQKGLLGGFGSLALFIRGCIWDWDALLWKI